MKVLLFSNDLMPFGTLPTSGGGLRCYQLMRGLEAHGVEVIASMPGFTYLAEKHFAQIPEEQREWLWRWETQDDLLRRAKPDAVMFASNWDHFNLTRPFDVPLIVDLHGSRLIETSMWNAPADTDKKVRTLGRADCLLCAGRRQRSYFYGWLVQAGRVPADEHFIRYIPISLSPELPERIVPQNDPAAPIFVSGGGWFPWQNQSAAIFGICNEVTRRDRGTVRIYGTPHETSNLSPEEQFIRGIYAKVKELSERSSRIQVNGYIGRDELVEIYRRSSVAVELMQYNLERELAFTTRTIEYLWCGLPVIYNNYAEISEHIAEYDAGWTLDPTSEVELSRALEEIFDSPEAVRVKSANAQRLVRDRFLWDKTILPLLDFLKHPSKAKPVEPVVGTVVARPSFLSPRGSAVDVGLSAVQPLLSQEFIVPAENITTISLPVALATPETRDLIERVELRVVGKSGRAAAKKSVAGSAIPASGQLHLNFPPFRAPKGGAQLRFELRVVPRGKMTGDDPLVFVQGLLAPTFPFVAQSEARLTGKSLLGEPVQAKAVALHFIPGSGGAYRIRLLASRAMMMIRRGEWRRLVRATMYRLPSVVRRLRRMVLTET